MIAPAETMLEAFRELFEDDHERVVVYADPAGETVLHEGPAMVRANGWVELPSGRLLSPATVHHIDTRHES